MPCVVWAEESKNGLRFEIGPSYDVISTRPHNFELMVNPAVAVLFLKDNKFPDDQIFQRFWMLPMPPYKGFSKRSL